MLFAVASLLRLGEATFAEISRLMQDEVESLETDVRLLAEFDWPECDPPPPSRLFRPISRGSVIAWSISPAYRDLLRRIGAPPGSFDAA